MNPTQKQELKGLMCGGCRDGRTICCDTGDGIQYHLAADSERHERCTANPAVIAKVDEMMAGREAEEAYYDGHLYTQAEVDGKIAAAEEATVEAAAKACEQQIRRFPMVTIELREAVVAIRALVHTSILANREAEIRRQERHAALTELKNALDLGEQFDVITGTKYFDHADVGSNYGERILAEMIAKAELTAPPTTGTAASQE